MPREALVLGDFNLTPDWPEYAAMVGPMDPDVGRLSYADGFVDAWVAAGHGEHDGVTYKAAPNRWPRDLRIDYCFVSAGLASRIRRAWIDSAAIASDHQPVWTDLDL
jgi:endonuclease/exonuclease/phosphatase family metal-dependent hydrolase